MDEAVSQPFRASQSTLPVTTSMDTTAANPVRTAAFLEIAGPTNVELSDPFIPPSESSAPELITKLTVTQVEYLGDVIRIAADPGTPQYAMTGPQYLDNDADGAIEPEDGDYMLPVAYPRGSEVIVTAKFKVETSTMPGSPFGTDVVRIEANAPGLYLPPTVATYSGGYVTLDPVNFDGNLPNYVDYNALFSINWRYSHEQAGYTKYDTWFASSSSNEMYVTLAAPTVTPIYHTSISLSVPNSTYATDEATVVSKTWDQFRTTTSVLSRHILPADNGKEITYYKEWDTKVTTFEGLLTAPTRDGQCTGFSGLFKNALECAGVVTLPITEVGVRSQNTKIAEAILVKNWFFSGEGTLKGQSHPYVNDLFDSSKAPAIPYGYARKNTTTDKWEYYWGTVAEANDDPDGVRGQNTSNPASFFSAHALVRIDGKLYDPSYGNGPFDNLKQWEDTSVSGYVRGNITADGKYRYLIRENTTDSDDIVEF